MRWPKVLDFPSSELGSMILTLLPLLEGFGGGFLGTSPVLLGTRGAEGDIVEDKSFLPLEWPDSLSLLLCGCFKVAR